MSAPSKLFEEVFDSKGATCVDTCDCGRTHFDSVGQGYGWKGPEHIGVDLPVTREKDMAMIALYDDRCVQIIPNTGIAIQDQIQRP